MTLKEARQECRNLCVEHNSYWWALSWNKVAGYYPTEPRKSPDNYHICWVLKDGRFCGASKGDEQKHNLKGNFVPHWMKRR